MKEKTFTIASLLSVPLMLGAGCWAANAISTRNLEIAEANHAESSRIQADIYKKLWANFEHYEHWSADVTLEVSDLNAFQQNEGCIAKHKLCTAPLPKSGYNFLNFQKVSITRALLECAKIDARCVDENVMPFAQQK